MTNIFKVNGQFRPKKLFISLLATLGIGFISSVFTLNARQIYQSLMGPSFAPPGWIFGPVWTILYIFMGIAVYRIWIYKNDNPMTSEPILIYLLQLLFNFIWCLLFFCLGLRGIAFIDIIVLWILIVVTMSVFKKIESIAFYLLIPYILWVSFASVLNYSVWVLNK